MKNIMRLVMVTMLLCGTYRRALAMLPYGMLKSGQKMARQIALRKKYPYVNPIKKQPLPFKENVFEEGVFNFSEEKAELVNAFLLPVEQTELAKLDLCPLFSQKESFALDPQLVAEMKDDLRKQGLSAMDIESQLASVSVNAGPQYHVFTENRLLSSGYNEPGFEGHEVSVNAPCTVSLGACGSWERMLLQYKSLDQFELADKTSLSQALCAGHSLNNSRLVRNYALTGDKDYLRKLHDLNDAANFLLDLSIDDWLNVEIVRKNIARVGEELGADGIDISVVSTVMLFDSDLDKKEGFEVFSKQEFDYVQSVKRQIQAGLAQEYYVHMIIVGNEEASISHGHYFAFAIIKVKNDIQYLVLDTLPSVYHLQEGSHERDRLMFVIDNVERGSSQITLANIRLRPEFLQSAGQVDEESKIEAELMNERMEEVGDLRGQIKILNEFSKVLNQFGIKKQLSNTPSEQLNDYLSIILQVEKAIGFDVYSAMKNLIAKEVARRD